VGRKKLLSDLLLLPCIIKHPETTTCDLDAGGALSNVELAPAYFRLATHILEGASDQVTPEIWIGTNRVLQRALSHGKYINGFRDGSMAVVRRSVCHENRVVRIEGG